MKNNTMGGVDKDGLPEESDFFDCLRDFQPQKSQGHLVSKGRDQKQFLVNLAEVKVFVLSFVK